MPPNDVCHEPTENHRIAIDTHWVVGHREMIAEFVHLRSGAVYTACDLQFRTLSETSCCSALDLFSGMRHIDGFGLL